jgi:hypothetical protein
MEVGSRKEKVKPTSVAQSPAGFCLPKKTLIMFARPGRQVNEKAAFLAGRTLP